VEQTSLNPPVADLEALRKKALMAGGVGLLLCVIGFVVDRDQFYRSWLIAFLLFLGISTGSMALMMIQHLSGGTWGVFRRVFEASARTLPLMAALFIPVLAGMTDLYPWSRPEVVDGDHILEHKVLYLNSGFFIARYVVYFVGWIAIAYTLTAWSKRQDEGDMSVNLKIQRLSGFGIVFYALTITFAGIDWIMSLNPHWYSTLFGFLMMGGQGLTTLAFTIIISRYLSQRPPMQELLKPAHFHDLGKLSLAFTMLWAYFNFSQFLLTYAANLVEEVPYFLARLDHGWQYLAIFLIVFHFFVPFFLLLSRDNKRASSRLVMIAAWIIFVRYVDIYMLVTPEFGSDGANLHMVRGEHASHFFVSWLDLAAPLAIGGLWMWMFATQLLQRPMLAFRDPYLRESLQSSGGH
jgi:hypothetical protein